MLIKNRILSITLLASMCLNVSANEVDSITPEPDRASTNALFQALKHHKDVAWYMAKAKTKKELIEISKKTSPLDNLSQHAKDRFVESVVFRDNGVAGFYYGDLEAELTPTQIHNVLSLIGAQTTVSKFDKARIESEADILLLQAPTIKYSRMSQTDLKKSIVSPHGPRADHKDYACRERATCREEQGSICMSSC